MRKRGVWTVLLLVGACDGKIVSGAAATDGGTDLASARAAPDLAKPPPAPDLATPPPAPDLAVAAVDNASVAASMLPTSMACGATFAASLTVTNTGTTTWTRQDGYKLGAVGDSDPFTAATRVELPDGASVPPGADYTFAGPLVAPGAAGSYVTDWQMVRENVHWFGAVASSNVAVSCAPPDMTAAPTTLDLHDATLYDNPMGLADWPVTTTITALTFGNDGLHIEFSKRDGPDSWPDVTPPGWDGPLEYTIGLAENIGGQWYASAAIQVWRGLYASGGNIAQGDQVAKNWYYDGRWGMLAGRQPATGETIGVFVVAGNARGVTDDGSQSPVHERSNVVLVPMPDASGASYTF